MINRTKGLRALSLILCFLMSFILLDLDFHSCAGCPHHQHLSLSMGADTAQARPRSGGGFGGGSYRPRPAPRPSPRPVAPKPSRPATPKSTPTPRAATPPKASNKAPTTSAAAQAAKRRQSAQKARLAAAKRAKPLPPAQRARVYGNRTPAQISRQRQAVVNSYPPQQRTVIVNRYGGFSDPFDPFFMYRISLLDIALMSTFHYHHWHSYDAARQERLLAENAEIRARMSALEAQGVARDASYVPKAEGLDPALMKTDEHVRADFGQPVEDRFPWGTALLWSLALSALGTVGYLVFVRRQRVPV